MLNKNRKKRVKAHRRRFQRTDGPLRETFKEKYLEATVIYNEKITPAKEES